MSRAGALRLLRLGLLLFLLMLGLLSYVQQVRQGELATGLRTIGAGGVAWGLYVVCDGFFAGMALLALAAASLARLSNERPSTGHTALPLAISGLVASAACVLADLGRPLEALWRLPLLARASSAFFSTFTIVVGMGLFLSCVLLVLSRGPQAVAGKRIPCSLSLFSFVMAVTGAFVLAYVFAVRPGRSAVLLEMASFVTLAAASTVAMLLLIAVARRGRAGADPEEPWEGSRIVPRRSGGSHAPFGDFVCTPPGLPTRISVALFVLIASSLLLVGLTEIASLRSALPATQRYAQALFRGSWSGVFWGEIACLGLALVASCLSVRGRPALGAVAALLALVASFAHHYLLLIAWQTDGLGLPYPSGAYRPRAVELGVVAGVLAAGTLLFLSLTRVAPALATLRASLEPVLLRLRRLGRVTALACLVLGICAALAGGALSAHWHAKSFADPILRGSPILFLFGLVLIASAGTIRELMAGPAVTDQQRETPEEPVSSRAEE